MRRGNEGECFPILKEKLWYNIYEETNERK